jgi:hypothetical protein
MSILTAYVVVAGTFTAGLQVARGVVRGAGKLIAGDTRGALAEVAAGAVAPVMSAYHQVCKLGEDVCRAAGALITEDQDAQPITPLVYLRTVKEDRTPESDRVNGVAQPARQSRRPAKATHVGHWRRWQRGQWPRSCRPTTRSASLARTCAAPPERWSPRTTSR